MGGMSADALKSAMDELYAVEPAGFVALRKQLAAGLRSSGDKETAATVAGLRKPTVAAAALNALARENDPPAIPELSDLGERMRTAQASMDTAALKELAKERTALVEDLLGRLGDLTPTVREQAGDTLIAALADQHAEDAVTSGQLVNPLSYSGFGEVEVSDAVAVPLRELQEARLAELAERERTKGAKRASSTADEPAVEEAPTEAPAAQPEPEPQEPGGKEPTSAPTNETGEADVDDLTELVDLARTAEREANAAVEAARTALAAAKDHAANATRARQLAEDLLDRAR